MKRLLMALVFVLALGLMAVSAQEMTPTPTAEPSATPAPTVVPLDVAVTMALSARLDLETLATLTFGADRPLGWSGNSNAEDPDLALFVRGDLELLSVSLPGIARPEGWFGVVSSSHYAIARDIRHDLELLADAAGLTPRPANWSSSEPILRCSRGTQALIRLLESTTSFTLQADRTAPDFCQQAEREVSVAAEIALDGSAFAEVQIAGTSDEPIVIDADAIGYIDLAGTARAGVIPQGERLEPVARQSGETAVLMLVRGVGFELFLDYTKTNVGRDTFLALPNAGAIRVNPRCTASWCD